MSDTVKPETDDDFNPVVQCWCGAKGRYNDLHDDDFLDETCGGSGVLHCECGGDFCVCHNHGEVECPGCPDCEDNGLEDGGYYDGDDE